MSGTRPILESVRQRVQLALPAVAVELFPDRPEQYRFMHPKAAVLIAKQSSTYRDLQDIGCVVQERQIVIHLTVFSRNLNGEMGGLDLIDVLGLALAGFKPNDCSPCHLLDEGFLTESGGAWQHYIRVKTETEQVQAVSDVDLPKFIRLRLRHADEPLATDLQAAAVPYA